MGRFGNKVMGCIADTTVPFLAFCGANMARLDSEGEEGTMCAMLGHHEQSFLY